MVTHHWPGELKEEVDRANWRQGKLCVHMGGALIWVFPNEITRYSSYTAEPRAFSHYTASPSPRPLQEELPISRLDWISGQGLLDAESIELPIRRSSIAHVIGARGRQVRLLEERLGVLIGVMDLGEEGGIVSLTGPTDRLLLARRVVELVSKGVRTLLDRWDWVPSAG